MALNCLCVGIGGAIGSVCRYLLGGAAVFAGQALVR